MAASEAVMSRLVLLINFQAMKYTQGTFEHLFSPFQLKNILLRNRIVKPAQWTVFANEDGSVSKQLLAHYESIAAGGAGLVTVEESIFDYPYGASNVPHLRLDVPEFLEGWKQLARTIKKNGAAAIVQVTHAGPAHSPLFANTTPVAPSRLDPPVEPVFAVARELTVQEIELLSDGFADAALMVKKAGFDGVELHMAHYALVNAFLSRVQNKRKDEYTGDTLQGRIRFSLDILRKTRQKVGDDFIIGIRMNGREWGHPDGTTLEEAKWFAERFQEQGADYLQVSAYGYGPYSLNALPDLVAYPEAVPEVKDFVDHIPVGALIEDAAAIREMLDIPVSGVGYIEPVPAEHMLDAGMVDLVCMGRPLLADPQLPNKLAEGRLNEITPCVRCNVCLHQILLAQPVQCRMNPFLGREGEWKIEPAVIPKKVIVVGAGPAGMEAARVAALRGHKVVIYDKESEIGGLVPMATFIKGGDVTDKMHEVINYYDRMLEYLDIVLHLNAEVNKGTLKMEFPDAVIIATGAKTVLPDIDGIDHKIVMTTDELRNRSSGYVHFFGANLMQAISQVYLPIGKNVVIIGGQMAGLQAAEFLIKRGRKVQVVEPGKDLGIGLPIPWLARLIPWLAAQNVGLHTQASDMSIHDGGVRFRNAEGETVDLAADQVLVVTQYAVNDVLYQKAKTEFKEVYLVGDANGPGTGSIQNAILQGAEAAMKL